LDSCLWHINLQEMELFNTDLNQAANVIGADSDVRDELTRSLWDRVDSETLEALSDERRASLEKTINNIVDYKMENRKPITKMEPKSIDVVSNKHLIVGDEMENVNVAGSISMMPPIQKPVVSDTNVEEVMPWDEAMDIKPWAVDPVTMEDVEEEIGKLDDSEVLPEVVVKPSPPGREQTQGTAPIPTQKALEEEQVLIEKKQLHDSVMVANDLGYRINNPGNLRPYYGYKGKVHDAGDAGLFMEFDDVEAGMAALRHDINVKITGGSSFVQPTDSIGRLFKVYAPSTDNNDPEAYAKFVADNVGAEVDTPIGDLNDEQIDSLVENIVRMESPNSYIEYYGEE